MAVDLTPTLTSVYINTGSVCIHYGHMCTCQSVVQSLRLHQFKTYGLNNSTEASSPSTTTLVLDSVYRIGFFFNV